MTKPCFSLLLKSSKSSPLAWWRNLVGALCSSLVGLRRRWAGWTCSCLSFKPSRQWTLLLWQGAWSSKKLPWIWAPRCKALTIRGYLGCTMLANYRFLNSAWLSSIRVYTGLWGIAGLRSCMAGQLSVSAGVVSKSYSQIKRRIMMETQSLQRFSRISSDRKPKHPSNSKQNTSRLLLKQLQQRTKSSSLT